MLARLGDPLKLAKACQNECMMEKGLNKSLKDVLLMLRFYCMTGLMRFMVIPVLVNYSEEN